MNMPRTILIPNGDNIVHTFSDKEFQNRQADASELIWRKITLIV